MIFLEKLLCLTQRGGSSTEPLFYGELLLFVQEVDGCDSVGGPVTAFNASVRREFRSGSAGLCVMLLKDSTDANVNTFANPYKEMFHTLFACILLSSKPCRGSCSRGTRL